MMDAIPDDLLSTPLDETLPPTPHRLALLPRMHRRMMAIVAECEQMLRDYEYWQGLPHNREHAGTIDVEDIRVTLSNARLRLREINRIRARFDGNG